MDTNVLTNFINGEFVESKDYIDSFNPGTGQVYLKVPDSNNDEINKAVAAAKGAFKKWSTTPVKTRAQMLNKIADLIEQKLDKFAAAESKDQGKTISFATNVDIPRAVHNLRHFAARCVHVMEKSNYMDEMDAMNYTSHMPIGVAGLISPWNLPLYLLTFKVAPALAYGNTVVCKPSEMTSVTAWMMCQVMKEAGLPPGVCNMIFGTGPKAGDALVRHPDVKLISFTGSTATAEKIRISAAPYTKKLSLELGGKNAGIVFADADLDKCIPTCVRSSFANQGEICLCTSRIFVQRPIYEVFLNKFIQGARGIKVGDPKSADSGMGALISLEHMNKVTSYIQYAVEDGGKVECGYGIDKITLSDENAKGYFVPPTVITGLSDSSRCMQQEIFGPVTCIVPFDSEDEVIERANGVEYGLCASLWSGNISTCHRVARKLEAGTVWVNCWLVRDLDFPFGGMKNSGIGREGTEGSLEFFTEEKTTCIKF